MPLVKRTTEVKLGTEHFPEKAGVLSLVGESENGQTALYVAEPSAHFINFGIDPDDYYQDEDDEIDWETTQYIVQCPYLYVGFTRYNRQILANHLYMSPVLLKKPDQELPRSSLCNQAWYGELCNPAYSTITITDKNEISVHTISDAFAGVWATTWNAGHGFPGNPFLCYVMNDGHNGSEVDIDANDYAKFLEKWSNMTMEEVMAAPYGKTGVTIRSALGYAKHEEIPRAYKWKGAYYREGKKLQFVDDPNKLPDRLKKAAPEPTKKARTAR